MRLRGRIKTKIKIKKYTQTVFYRVDALVGHHAEKERKKERKQKKQKPALRISGHRIKSNQRASTLFRDEALHKETPN